MVSPDAEARTLLAHVAGMGVDRLFLLSELTASQREALDAAVGRRLAGEPVQHITGEAWFRHVRVAVGPGVFIPRPETELLAGWAIEWLDEREPGREVVELCAGSGAVSLAIATEAPGHRGHAIEVSPHAHAWAVRNLAGTQVDLRLGDMADSFADLDGRVDLVVVNPPYVPTSTAVPADVHHDPELAVFSGEDGLDAIRIVADVTARLLAPGGVLACEHDESHPDQVRRLFAEAGLGEIVTHDDLAGRPRFTTAVAGCSRE